MKKITVDYEVYSIDELSENAREKAYYSWLRDFDYPWADDNRATLDKFENIFPIKVKNWEYGYRKYINFEMTCDDEIAELSGIRLLKYIYNNYYDFLYKGRYYSIRHCDENGKYSFKYKYSKVIKDNSCPLTGYYMDDEILEPIYKFLKNPSPSITFENLMYKCLDNWLYACDKDYEYCTSMEYFIEESRDNGWEYFEDGTFASFSKGKIVS